MATKLPVLILYAEGTNRARDAALACERAGAAPRVAHVADVARGASPLRDHRMLVLPGGFSYGDDLGAGGLWALALKRELGEALRRFVEEGRPVLGICNGFQALARAGLVPGPNAGVDLRPRVTLAANRSARFECRWVRLRPEPASPCAFTRELREPLHCPVAHGEGRVVVGGDAERRRLRERGLVALRYAAADGSVASGYPDDPNGSEEAIAGLTNVGGNVLGLMPHPENHVEPAQHPRRGPGRRGAPGLALFEAGLRHAARL